MILAKDSYRSNTIGTNTTYYIAPLSDAALCSHKEATVLFIGIYRNIGDIGHLED
jgi:hypothetical protein